MFLADEDDIAKYFGAGFTLPARAAAVAARRARQSAQPEQDQTDENDPPGGEE